MFFVLHCAVFSICVLLVLGAMLLFVCFGACPGCSDSGGCKCGDFPPRLIHPHCAPGSFVVIWIMVVVFVLAGGCAGRRWPCSIVCSVCVFLVLVEQRLGRVVDPVLFAVVEVLKTRKGLVRLTQKGLISDVLNSSLDLSF